MDSTTIERHPNFKANIKAMKSEDYDREELSLMACAWCGHYTVDHQWSGPGVCLIEGCDCKEAIGAIAPEGQALDDDMKTFGETEAEFTAFVLKVWDEADFPEGSDVPSEFDIPTDEMDNQACITGRLHDFVLFLHAQGMLNKEWQNEEITKEQDLEDFASEMSATYIGQVLEHEDEPPEWVGALNYGRHQDVLVEGVNELKAYFEASGGGDQEMIDIYGEELAAALAKIVNG